jgi:hypothetical protein
MGISGSSVPSTASSLVIAADTSGTGDKQGQVYGNASLLGQSFPIDNIPIITAQTAFYACANPAGNFVLISSYNF